MTGKYKQLWAAISDFMEGAFNMHASNVIRKEAFDLNDSFFLLLVGDFLGLPNPFSYHALELLPYLADELESWERRILARKSIIAEKFGQFDFCC